MTGDRKKKSAAAKLPPDLAVRLKSQLGERGFREFLTCLDDPPFAGLRFNIGKGAAEDLARLLPFPLEPISWAPAGFLFPQGERPGKLPYYHAGLYYLQEPSAMAPAAALGVRPGDRVLDMCAAPGGKTTQLAAALAGKGQLLANDNNSRRIKSLLWNLEHWGVTNAVVFYEEPRRLTPVFRGYFDRILVDAPCSGEGMLRKEPKSLSGWRRHTGKACREIQDVLLEHAAMMLRPGGRMVYSTCTFDPIENEEAVVAFLERKPEFSAVDPPVCEDWTKGGLLRESRQLWPHLARGEGQFFALLEKRGDGAARMPETKPGSGEPSPCPAELDPFLEFMTENLSQPLTGSFALYGNHVYRRPDGLPDLAGLKVARPGWYLGMIRNRRFYPGQPMAMGIEAKRMKRRLDLDPHSGEVESYLKGETLMMGGDPGWTLVTVKGFPLGFGKQTGDFLKNEYAGGWRIMQ